MSFDTVPAAKDLSKITEDFNCIIEIPAESDRSTKLHQYHA